MLNKENQNITQSEVISTVLMPLNKQIDALGLLQPTEANVAARLILNACGNAVKEILLGASSVDNLTSTQAYKQQFFQGKSIFAAQQTNTVPATDLSETEPPPSIIFSNNQ